MTEPSDSPLLGRTILITGANTGIGRSAALMLARRGAKMVLAGRSEERHRPVLDAIRSAGGDARFIALDLGDLASVERCAEAFLAWDEPLHVLLNNAGLAGNKGLTAQGFERTFGVNHLGPYALTERLLDRVKRSAPARIVNVASGSHYRVRKLDFDAFSRPTASITGFPEYAVSKLCNVLYTMDLAERLEGTGVTTYSLNPGQVATDVWRKIPWPFRSLMKMRMLSEDEGAATSVYCAASPDCADETGLYYDTCRVKEPAALARDRGLREELMRRSREWAGVE
ncbi:MAG: SDR family oxidoreductase [Sandaracinaceae bacterium]